MVDSKSDMIILHVGHKDLWIGHKTKDVIKDLKEIISELLSHTETRVCISLIIPGSGQYPRLEKEVSIVNKAIAEHISSLRKDKRFSNRVFTANNNRLREFMSKDVGPNGTQLTLSSKGKNLLWLRLRDNMTRSLKSPQSKENSGIQHFSSKRVTG